MNLGHALGARTAAAIREQQQAAAWRAGEQARQWAAERARQNAWAAGEQARQWAAEQARQDAWRAGERARQWAAEEAEAERIRNLARGFWHQVGSTSVEWVREVVARYDPIRFEVWTTAADERTCPICGQLEGVVWSAGEGFMPPVHDHCRCQRRYHHTEFSVRWIEQWSQRTTYHSWWEWRTNAW